MKKKFAVLFLAIAACFACIFGLTACGDENNINSGKGVTEVILSQNTLSLVTGESKNLSATVKSDNDAAVGWSSSDESVATVTNGTVTAIKEGTTVIVAVAGNKVATCIVTVKSQLEQALNGYVYSLKNDGYEITKVIDAHITEAIIPDIVTSIAFDAFRGCAELKKLVIPDSVTYIGYGAFEGCESLEEATIPCLAISKIPKQNLKKVVLTSGDTIENNAFDHCSSLTSVTIGNSVVSIGGCAFDGCSSLTSVTIPDSVTSIGYSSFYNCTSLTIYCEAESKPSGWDLSWKYGCPVVWNCKNNEVADDRYIYAIIDGIRYSLKDGITVVGQPSNITTANIPAKVSYKNVVYSVTRIGEDAFSGCSALTSITIPDSVTSIGSDAFHGCSSLTRINYGGTKAQWNSVKKGYQWNRNTGNYTVYCTDGQITKF